jgi:hypothetical protein
MDIGSEEVVATMDDDSSPAQAQEIKSGDEGKADGSGAQHSTRVPRSHNDILGKPVVG